MSVFGLITSQAKDRIISGLFVFDLLIIHLNLYICTPFFELFAWMAELVDALVSGTSVSNDVQVRVLFWAQIFLLFVLPGPRW